MTDGQTDNDGQTDDNRVISSTVTQVRLAKMASVKTGIVIKKARMICSGKNRPRAFVRTVKMFRGLRVTSLKHLVELFIVM